jgi:hypothetical protein
VRVFPVVLGLGLFLILTRGALMFSTDSVFYWSASRTLLDQHELATGVVYSTTPLEPGLLEGHPQALHPLTVFAPGYAVATALVARATGTSIVSATLLVNMLSGAAIILLAGNLARRSAGERAGCVAAALVAVLPFFQTMLANALSELLFVAFMLLALQLMIGWTDAPERGALKLHMASLAIAAATYTRYIGLSLYLVQVVVVAQYLLRSRPTGGRRLRVALTLGMYPVLMLPLTWRNLSLTGYFGGAARPPSNKGVFANLLDVPKGLFDALPLVRSTVPGPADAIVSGALLAAPMLVALVWHRSRTRHASVGSATSPRLLAWTVGIYCSVLVVLRSRTSLEDIGLRLLFPALVCLAIFAVIGMCNQVGKSRQAAVGAVWVMCAASAGIVEFRARPDSLTSSREWNRPVVAWARQNLTPQAAKTAVIFSDDIYPLHFASGQPIHILPPVWTLQELRAKLPVDRLIFVIGSHAELLMFDAESERNGYEEALNQLPGVIQRAGDIRRREDYTVWCIPTVRHETTSSSGCFKP